MWRSLGKNQRVGDGAVGEGGGSPVLDQVINPSPEPLSLLIFLVSAIPSRDIFSADYYCRPNPLPWLLSSTRR